MKTDDDYGIEFLKQYPDIYEDIEKNTYENKNNHLNVNSELEYSNVAENCHLNDKLKELK